MLQIIVKHVTPYTRIIHVIHSITCHLGKWVMERVIHSLARNDNKIYQDGGENKVNLIVAYVPSNKPGSASTPTVLMRDRPSCASFAFALGLFALGSSVVLPFVLSMHPHPSLIFELNFLRDLNFSQDGIRAQLLLEELGHRRLGLGRVNWLT